MSRFPKGKQINLPKIRLDIWGLTDYYLLWAPAIFVAKTHLGFSDFFS